MLGLDGTVHRANRAWAEVLPWTEGPAGFESFRDHVHADDLGAFDEIVRVVSAGDEVRDTVLRVHDGQAGYRRIEWTSRHDVGAELVVVRGRDVTEDYRRAREHEARAERLQRTNDDLQEFAYVASHDLSEPLRMVTSYLDLVRRRYDDQLDDAGREFIHYAVDGAHRMRALIDDLLVYSRVGAGDVRRERVNLDDVMASVRHDLAAAIDDAGAEVRWRDLGVVRGDATQIGQLLQNLVANAVKFRGETPPVVEVSRETTDDADLIRVRDNGIGIAAGPRREDLSGVRAAASACGVHGDRDRSVDLPPHRGTARRHARRRVHVGGRRHIHHHAADRTSRGTVIPCNH